MKRRSILIKIYWLLLLLGICSPMNSQNESRPSTGSTSAVAGAQYNKSKFKQRIFGKHYRSTWATPIHDVPILDVENFDGGLVPYEKGGGAQTLSLKFKSANGRQYAFRSVDKNPTRNKDQDLVAGVYGKIVRGLTTTQHPYGSTIITSLMDKLELPHSNPQLFIMPDASVLDTFNKEFAGLLGWLELKPKGKKKNRPGFQDADKVVSTLKMYDKLLADHDNTIDVEKYVRARIFDIWISDWDRHEDNWKWLGYKGEEGWYYTPFPKDRDKALVILNGVYKALDWEFVAPDMANFTPKYKGLKSLNYKNRSMDRWFANSYTYEDWILVAKEIQRLMTDEVIEAAIATMPKEVQHLTSERISRVLKIRRDNLPQVIGQYYKMLAKYIDLVGSDKAEYFALNRLSNGDVQAQIFKFKEGKKKGKLLYSRQFRKQETKEIRVHGLGAIDHFEITGSANKSILIRIIGGADQDVIKDDSSIKGIRKLTKIYDKRGQDDVLVKGEAEKVFTPQKLTFHPQKIFEDDHLVILPYLAYNRDDGFVFGIAGQSTIQGFNKPGFKIRTTFRGDITTMGNYGLRANTQFRHLMHQWDLVLGINATGNDRNLQRFYGFGNESLLDETLRAVDFYENNTASVEIYVGARRDFLKKSSFITTLKYDHKEVTPTPNDEASGSIYDQLPANSGLGKTNLFGLDQTLDLDFRDAHHFPTKGTQFKLKNYTFFNPGLDWETGGRIESQVSTFFTKGQKLPTTLSLRGGFSKAYGNTPFYYQSFLGQQSNHRGFLRNRFAGETAVFLNTDLRLHFGTKVTSLIPIKYGIFGLYDVGRVWSESENSDKLHSAIGGGVYLIPYKESINLTFTVAHSNENNLLFSFRMGFFVR